MIKSIHTKGTQQSFYWINEWFPCLPSPNHHTTINKIYSIIIVFFYNNIMPDPPRLTSNDFNISRDIMDINV